MDGQLVSQNRLFTGRNICPDIEFIVMFEKRDKPAAINMSIDGKARTNGQFSPMSKRRFVKNRFYPKHNRQ